MRTGVRTAMGLGGGNQGRVGDKTAEGGVEGSGREETKRTQRGAVQSAAGKPKDA